MQRKQNLMPSPLLSFLCFLFHTNSGDINIYFWSHALWVDEQSLYADSGYGGSTSFLGCKEWEKKVQHELPNSTVSIRFTKLTNFVETINQIPTEMFRFCSFNKFMVLLTQTLSYEVYVVFNKFLLIPYTILIIVMFRAELYAM